ncbi:DUF805 domain-containing protein [Endozoicomonas numazuensis]|uniref:DUF805 domain-containing protein n=1 Tax=Endozoicomonas numazuensis TaxID=1137799 RepID=A0A081NKY8_9GAMM|nr:DUF805 domain-containing protein [Endozoicomonas numazuensis]KEQ19111.1 hypothetical protein GZ78_03640 [Endozoicomonas numazuensis]
MKRKDYKVLFEGQILPDFSEAEARNNLARLFNADEQRINRLFSGKPYAVRKPVTEKEARKYEKAINKAGGQCRIVTMDGSKTLPSPDEKNTSIFADSPLPKTSRQNTLEPLRLIRRIGRTRYLALSWLVVAIEAVAFLLPDYLPMLIGAALTIQQTVSMVLGIHSLAIMLTLYLVITRLHDMDRSGWLWLFLVIPIVNILFLFWLSVGSGSEGKNNYGDPPLPPANLTRAVGIYLPLSLLVVGVAGAYLNQEQLVAWIQLLPEATSEWTGLEYPG